MPWFFAIPEFLKKRACRYLLQHYLGQFLEERISLDDLTVDLYNGTGTINNVPLNVEAINDALQGTSAPVKVVSGYIGRVTVSVPWTALLKDSCRVEISGLALSIAPDVIPTCTDELVSMTDSLFFSMSGSSSMQLAEEVLRSGPSPGEGEVGNSPGFEGMEALARAIELVLARVQVTFTDAVVQVNYRTPDYTQEYFLKVRVRSVEFFDEMSRVESSVDVEEEEDLPQPAAITVKVLQLSGLTVELGSTDLSNVRADPEESFNVSTDTLMAFSPPSFMAPLQDPSAPPTPLRQPPSLSEDSYGVPIARASRDVIVKVKVKQSESLLGPKLEVEGFVGSLHLLISPQQLSMLLEMVTGISNKGTSASFERFHPGQNRPIPKNDMRTIESQLRHQLKEQKMKSQQREDLLHADPWENSLRSSNMGESTCSSSDEFFSLDLNSSYTATPLEKTKNMEDSFISTTSKVGGDSSAAVLPSSASHIHGRCVPSNMESIPLHGGTGLQQLSESPSLSSRKLSTPPTRSPPLQRPRSGSSNVSTTSSSPRSTGVRSRWQSESPHDLCKYSLTISGVTIALLEADPMYTYTTPGLPRENSTSGSPSNSINSSTGSSCYGRYSSVDEGGLDPVKYFETMAELLKEGVNKVAFKSEQEKLAHVLPNDHLFMWLSTLRGGVSSEGPQLELNFSVASAELWEYLYRNEASLPHITKPVSVSPLLQLVEDSALSKPSLKLKFSTSGEHGKKQRHSGCSEPQTNLNLSLTTAHVNADVTLMDRLQPLLRASLHSQHSSLRSGGTLGQTMKHSLYMTNSNYHLVNLQRQAVFNQAVAVESGGRREQRMNLRINCSTLNISLRFPIPDLRQDTRPPWYHPSLRPEVLYVSLSDIQGSSLLHSGMLQEQMTSTFDIQFKDAKTYLSCDGSVEGRTLFLTVSGSQRRIEETESDADLNTASISVVIQPVSDSILEEVNKIPVRGGGRGVGSDPPSSYEGFEMPSGEPSPFSKRRAMFSTGKMVERGENGEEVHSEELVMPGSSREMAEFEQHAMSLTRCSVTCTLPSVSIHLPSKDFLETLYNRFATDLVLWQPATPASVEKANAAKSMLYSCMDVLQPAATQEDRFMMCKSVLKEEESDEEGNDEVSHVLHQPPIPHDGPLAPPQRFSTLAFSLNVERGRVSMTTAVEEPPSDGCDDDPTSSVYTSATSDGHLLDLSPRRNSAPATHHEHGLVVATLSNIHAFAVTGYLGDSSHDYFFVQLHEFSLHHLGSLEAANLAPYSCLLEEETTPILASLCPVVFKSRRDGSHPRHGSSCEEEEEPMLAVAMEMRLDKLRNSKTSKCAVVLRNTTVQYHMTSVEHSCFKQLGTFFDLVDEPVLGYEPPSLITELHAHLRECAMEYRPLHLPLSVMLMIQSVSLSTNVVTGSPLLVVKLMVDGTYLFLSNSQEDTTCQQQNWVCVMEMDWFEMTLRLCNNAQCEGDYQKLFSRLPEISLECSSNILHLRTCVDSCIALRDLLVYLATNGDLRPHSQETVQLRDYSSLVSDVSPPSSLNSYSGLPPVSTLNGDADIGDLISDAMEDIPSPETSSRAGSMNKRETTARRGKAAFSSAAGLSADRKSRSRKVVGEHLRPRPSKSKMQIHVSNEKSVHMVFDSDSDSESGGGVHSGSVSGVGVHSPRGRLSGSEQGSIFSESDEDFCILDAPTTTKVPLGAQPVVKCLLNQGEDLKVEENHFTVPDQHTDQLQRPKHFPEPVTQYTLKEITVIWHLYGGHDFGSPPQNSLSGTPSSSPSSNAHTVHCGSKDGSRSTPSSSAAARTRQYGGASGSGGQGSSTSPVILRKYSTSPKSSSSSSLSTAFGGPKSKGRKVAGGKRPGGPHDWKTAGGPGRDHNVLMELELDKLRVQYEVYPPDTHQASRLALLVREVEVRDRLLHSQINKFFYQYTTESMPRQSHANMVCLKVLFTRPELATQPSIEEAAVRLSVLPVRLNIDQDAVFFLYEFLRQVADMASLGVSDVLTSDSGLEEKRMSSGGGGERTSTSQQPGEVFIRSFVFHPDLPIRVDYEGKRFDTMAVGTLAGILLGLSHLDCSEVRLKALTYKKGLLGWDKVVEYASREWIEDIKGSQLPLILKGVGPVHHVTQLVQGMVDLVWLPVQQYQEDGRIVRGLQRGASSFSTSSGVAIVELLSRALHTVQSFAQMAYDLVTPSKQQSSSQALVHQHKAPHEPLDFREGLANAYDVVSAGIGGTARDLVTVATHEHDERGMTGAVGGVLRQLPGTIVKPVILMSEATRHVLGGVKNQFVPDARREATDKWKTTEAAEP